MSITSMKADIDTHAALKDAPKVSVTTKDAVLTINPAPQKPGSGSGGSGGHHHKGGSSSDSSTSGSGAAAPAENPTREDSIRINNNHKKHTTFCF